MFESAVELFGGKYFEAVASGAKTPKAAANWVINNLRAKLTETATPLEAVKIQPRDINELVALVEREAHELGLKAVVRQSDNEADLLNLVHAAADAGDPVVLNAGALTHTSVALRDACAELSAPLIEVHISNVHTREEFRHHSYISAVATGVIVGLGVQGYVLALRYLASLG